MNDFCREHEYRIPRRMRLVIRDIEVADAEREVDRIEIFERGRQKRQMKRDETDNERGGAEVGQTRHRASRWRSWSKSAAAAGLR